ncbi:depupylase/deamidase Dop [Serinibacter arcticus]|uniref:depupylase/deamidase Dop n=1 Tax=Serinibacter arcticus TaxID=1655435 RepID=UPI0018EE9AAE|nr:depupylase/deamidase Dop [Serinibacter arcticus]
MGIETEYGILGGEGARQNPMALSALVVAAYAQAVPRPGRTRWSYESEDPLSDARGWRIDRAAAHPSQLTDVGRSDEPEPDDDGDAPLRVTLTRRRRPVSPERDDPAATNVLLTNGARLYVDHAHPEYSSPEVLTARDAVAWDRAGERVMLEAVRTLAASPHTPDVHLYKNNVDGKGASYGTHENYLVDRAVPFGDIVDYLTAFLVTRTIMVGSGRVGLGVSGEIPGFQLSQRADYMEAEVGLETTLRRPIINTRDEPHADPGRFRRLHVIIGDANCFETATYLKLGTTSLVLSVLEAAQRGAQIPLSWEAAHLADPVASVQTVSRDLSLTAELDTAGDGVPLTALQIQRYYAAGVREVLGDDLTEDDAAVLAAWERTLDLLEHDHDTAAREVEWLAKLRVLEGLRERHHLAWDHAKLAALDLQWSDVRPERGICARLRASGGVATVVPPDEVERAVTHPPTDTRAWFRGEALRRYPEAVAAAGWDGVVLDVPGEPTLVRVPMPDPRRGTQALMGALLDRHPTAATLVAELGGAARAARRADPPRWPHPRRRHPTPPGGTCRPSRGYFLPLEGVLRASRGGSSRRSRGYFPPLAGVLRASRGGSSRRSRGSFRSLEGIVADALGGDSRRRSRAIAVVPTTPITPGQDSNNPLEGPERPPRGTTSTPWRDNKYPLEGQEVPPQGWGPGGAAR